MVEDLSCAGKYCLSTIKIHVLIACLKYSKKVNYKCDIVLFFVQLAKMSCSIYFPWNWPVIGMHVLYLCLMVLVGGTVWWYYCWGFRFLVHICFRWHFRVWFAFCIGFKNSRCQMFAQGRFCCMSCSLWVIDRVFLESLMQIQRARTAITRCLHGCWTSPDYQPRLEVLSTMLTSEQI